MSKFAIRFISLALLCTGLLLPEEASSAKILSVAFISSKSQKITYERLLGELANRGHKVTVVSPFLGSKPHPNIRDIQTIKDVEKYFPEMFGMKEKDEEMNPYAMLASFGHLCKAAYDVPEVKALLKEKFDLVFLPALFNECGAGLIHKLNTSTILISPTVAPSWIVRGLGGPAPPSFVPSLFAKYGDRMSFLERLSNFFGLFVLGVMQDLSYKPTMEAIYRDKLNDSSIPSSDEILKNVSLVLSNSHLSLSTPRPFLPDVIEVGGMHCEPAKPLPRDLEEFVQSSGKDGFILFSMGSALKGSMMPDKKRKVILGAFAKLKQKVLWKWETETMEDLPKNVKLSKWLPQQDVLGHPKCRLFITHGGFGSITEAVYHGVPLVGIPMFGDQHLNMQRAESSGYAIPLDYSNLNEEDLIAAINKLINEPSYKNNVQALSNVFRDQPDKALDRAVFWTEYVLRHKGAVHLRSAARDLNFFQYHSIDVVAFIFAVVFLALYIVFALLRLIVGKICGSSKNAKITAKKKQK